MKAIVYLAVVIGMLSLLVGVISRLTMTPVLVVRGGLEAEAFLAFTNTCLLIATTFILLQILKSKQ